MHQRLRKDSSHVIFHSSPPLLVFSFHSPLDADADANPDRDVVSPFYAVLEYSMPVVCSIDVAGDFALLALADT
jgi:hypothetical protein